MGKGKNRLLKNNKKADVTEECNKERNWRI